MSDPHASDSPMVGDPHGSADHGDGHGHDDHAHEAESVGPIDWPAWGAGLLGLAIALAIVATFVLATGPLPSPY